jgi:hypothetical protein
MNPVDNINVLNGFTRMNIQGNRDIIFSNKNGISKTSPAVTQVKEEIPDNLGNPPESLEAKDALNKISKQFSIVDKGKELTVIEKLEVRELEQLERSVRQHERAHLQTARDIAVGGVDFKYKRGPDGQKYVVNGEVDIDASSVSGNTRATIEKALKVQNSALAPSDPSPKDLRAAAQARIMEAKAYRKLSREQQNEEKINSNSQKPGEIPFSTGYNVYQTSVERQENLFNILDLFA